MKALIELNGKKTEIEITVEQAEQLGLVEKKKTGWERVEELEHYYLICGSKIITLKDSNYQFEVESYGMANYFSTQSKAEQVNKLQVLWRRMQRFADENNEGEIDWEDEKQSKYYICTDYEHWNSELLIDYCCTDRIPFVIYFTSKEIAKKALELFEEELKEAMML